MIFQWGSLILAFKADKLNGFLAEKQIEWNMREREGVL